MQRIDSRTQVVDQASEFYFCSNRRGELVNLILGKKGYNFEA